MDILYGVVATNMGIKKADLKSHEGSLINFSGKHVLVEGSRKLRVTFGTCPKVVDTDLDFLVVNAPNIAYNTIMRQTSLNMA